MNKLYIGSLPADVNEGTLRQLFQEHGITCTNVLVKKGGYAFVDCPDQTSVDKAIDKLNGELGTSFYFLNTRHDRLGRPRSNIEVVVCHKKKDIPTSEFSE